MVLESMAEFEDQEEQPSGPKVRVADYAYSFNEMFVDYGIRDNDVLVVDVDYQVRRRQLRPMTSALKSIGSSSFSAIRGASRELVSPLPSFNPMLRSTVSALLAQGSDDPDDDMPSIGVNTDGQVLYGPPGSKASWGCTGYGSIDTCKACCMATRTLGVAPIVAFAKWCHTLANGCTVAAWACHAGCGLAEAGMVAALLYSTNECNHNCEHVYWNDTSIDWAGQSSHALYWDPEDLVECRGIVKGDFVTLNGGEHISIPGYGVVSQIPDSGRWAVECVVLRNEVTAVDFRYGGIGDTDTRFLGRPVPCPPAQKPTCPRCRPPTVEVSHQGIQCLDIVDYRIVDIDQQARYDQTPHVGIVRWDEARESMYINIMRTDERMYLDDGYWWPWPGMKSWIWGNRSGDRIEVLDFDFLGYYAE
jgi:hypothetical protein